MNAFRLEISRRLGAACLLLGVLVVSGCNNNVTRAFGLTRDAPDEFTVTTRAPLSMPPDFSLRPPQPGAPRPQERTDTQQAEAALAPQTALSPTSGPSSPGQQALLRQAGPAVSPEIRQQVNAEAVAAAQDRSLTEGLEFWKEPPPPGIVVDPTREAQRLRDNAALGQNPATGDTPIIQPRAKNFWEKLF